jgi:hypothetical protein
MAQTQAYYKDLNIRQVEEHEIQYKHCIVRFKQRLPEHHQALVANTDVAGNPALWSSVPESTVAFALSGAIRVCWECQRDRRSSGQFKSTQVRRLMEQKKLFDALHVTGPQCPIRNSKCSPSYP